MSSVEEFKQKYFAAKTHIEKVQVCIGEQRYSIWERADKPNLNSEDYVSPILNLPTNHPCSYRQRKSGGAGAKFVIEFKYSVTILGEVLNLYFKGFFTDDWTLKLEIQSLRDNKET